MSNIDLTIALPDFRYRAELDGVVENEICPVLIGFTEDQPVPNPEEVSAVKWMAWSEACDGRRPESTLSPWAIEEVELLAQSEGLKFSGESKSCRQDLNGK